MFDVNDFRLEFAKNLESLYAIKSTDQNRKQIVYEQTDNRGVDVAIVATGNLKALTDAIELVRKGGTIILFGVPSKGAKLELDMSTVYSKEITHYTSYAASDLQIQILHLKLIKSSKVDVKKLITHKYQISDLKKPLIMLIMVLIQ